jgi:hypothetical protein
VPHVEFARGAVDDLDELILSHSLPSDTRIRVRRSLEALQAWAEEDLVLVVTVQDGRSSRPATATKR